MGIRPVFPGWTVAVLTGVFGGGLAQAAALLCGGPVEPGGGVVARNNREVFDYFANSWTVVGLKDHPAGVRISPAMDLFLGDGLIVRPLAGVPLRPLNNGIRRIWRDGALPIASASFTIGERVSYTVETAAAPLDPSGESGFDWPTSASFLCVLRITVTNVSSAPAEAAFGLQWRPKTGDIPLQLTAIAPQVHAIGSEDLFFGSVRAGPGLSVRTEGSLVRAHARLEPQADEAVCFILPYVPMPTTDVPDHEVFSAADGASVLNRVESFWQRLLKQGAQLEVPEEKVLETYRASLVHLFIGRDQGEVRGGEGFYDETYIRDGVYQVLALARAGFVDEARRSMDLLLRFQRPDGRFESQKDQYDANGYAMWAPVELFALSGDVGWLASVYPAILKAARWVEQARGREKDPASPFFGILPTGIADGEFLWEGGHHIVGYDWQNLRGLRAVARAARVLGRDDEARELERQAEDYRNCIMKALERTGLAHIPPSYENAGTHWGNLEAVFPTALIDPFDPRLSATVRLVRDAFGRSPDNPGGYIEGVIQWNPPHSRAIHPYLTQFVTNTHLVRREKEEALDGFYALLLHSTSTHGFPEGVYWRQRIAWSNTIPHLWAGALYMITLHNMLLREEGDELHLLPCVPEHWLTNAPGVRVRGVPTSFGKVGLSAVLDSDTLTVNIEPPERSSPEAMVIHAPAGMVLEEAEVGGERLAGLEPAQLRIELRVAGRGVIRLRVRRLSDTPSMTFQARVEAFLREARPAPSPIPGVVPTPSPDDLAEAEFVPLDLSRAATTDALTGPFGVLRPGRYVFAGLAPGDRKVCGVPFRILDPSANNGRNLVVLHGANASEALAREVEVNAGDVAGRYLCILGNVTGWAAGTPGSEQHDPLAEYEIRYADGRVQKVPLLTDRTADDWTGPALALEAESALRGDPWHLNLLTIVLEPVPVRSIVIRDLGTPASPVVAAMTLVR